MITHGIASAPSFARYAAEWVSAWRGKCRNAASLRREERSLRLRETVSLGDRRILAVVEFCGKRFLVGSTPGSISLLASEGDGCQEQDTNDGGIDG